MPVSAAGPAQVLETFSKLEKKLGDRPVKLEDFASFYKNHVELSESKAKYAESNQMVVDMYEMLTTYGGKVPPNDQLNLDDLKDMVTAYTKVGMCTRVLASGSAACIWRGAGVRQGGVLTCLGGSFFRLWRRARRSLTSARPA